MNGHGRAFPFKEHENQWLGPAVIDGKVWRMMIWLNMSKDGRSYLRIAFEEPNEDET